MKKIIALTLLVGTLALNGLAHCQIPCGIYDDATRFTLMREHVATIEKSMVEIAKLAPDASNQLIRWVNNKEEHANQLTEIVTAYFLAQRIKPSEPKEKYITELKLLHRIMIASMKSKQTTNLDFPRELKELIEEFESIYLGKSQTPSHTH